ncbi:hypothetical protein HNY73_022996 [Argiope bruennichi]|uniref:Uncharacterized protein n=1 Tax=Argiope bruennichi TaxID=94029 RepID=A0A8T0E3H4_ARGBR|nr:hypothetical protein HNY73_022996 [Argiope bruennichi]
MDQIAEIKKRSKSVSEECQELSNSQMKMQENVSEVKTYLRKIQIRIEHVQEITTISEKKNEELKNELVSAKSEITVLKNSVLPMKLKTEPNIDLRKMDEKYSELEKLFALSQKENEKTLSNFLESNRLLCEAMNKYADAQETEKILNAKIEACENEIVTLKSKAKFQNELSEKARDNDFTNDRRNIITESKETQTLKDIMDENCSENIIAESDLLENVNNKNSISNQFNETEHFPNNICTHTTNEANPPEQVSNKFPSFKENVTASLGTSMKRKLSLIDDDESELSRKKLFCSANVVNPKNDWESENQVHRMFSPLIEDEKSIPSSINSLDDIGLSQGKQENEEFNKSANVDIIREENNGIQVEVETVDVTSVQMNLKDLKVSDSGSTSTREEVDDCIHVREK